ncbi:MAG TPA: GMC family oxidoreductase [Rhizomicrobium sp.]|nr:GMC family oxidoreductase [Rhizomicrobium sp.]
MVHVAAAASDRWDAVVVGSGAGGSSIAFQLAKRGAQVLVVERGDFLKTDNDAPDAPIGKYLYDVWPDQCNGQVGGLTKFFGAALYRLRESDFRAVQHENGMSPAWPVSYSDLAPYYDRAEELYRVHGDWAGDPSEPPHASSYPFPPIPHHPVVAEMAERLTRAGIAVSSIPLALDYGPGGRCTLCPTCDAHYCRRDAKMDAEIAALRPALATKKVQLLTRTECLKVETSPDGRRATAVVVRNQDGVRRITADAVVLSAGIPETAAILRRSRTDRHAAGLGNAGGALGRYHSGHSVGHVFPLVSARKLRDVHSKTMAINAFHEDADGPLGIIQAVGRMPFWRQAPPFLRPIIRFIGERSLAFFYATEALPTWHSGVVFQGDEIVAKIEPTHNLTTFAKLRGVAVEAFRRAGYPVVARARAPYLWHDAGTACFGADPASSVCDPDCQVHGVSGLYVVDQSILPSAGCVNTTLTVIALALRAGDHIARAMREQDMAQRSARRRPEDVVDLARTG